MKKLMIIEPHSKGHRLHYPRRIIQEAIHRRLHVILVTMEDNNDSIILKSIKEKYGNKVEIILLKSDIPILLSVNRQILKEIRYFLLFYRFYHGLDNHEKPDYIILPFVDYCYRISSICGSPFGDTPWGGIIFSVQFHYWIFLNGAQKTSFNNIRIWLFRKLLAQPHLKVLYTIDELLMRYINLERDQNTWKLTYVPDPIDQNPRSDRSRARHQIGIKDSEKVLLVYGALSTRKGIKELLTSVNKGKLYRKLVIIFAGEQDNEIRVYFKKYFNNINPDLRIIIYDKYLSDDEENKILSSADIMWVGYKEFLQMSGVLVLAASRGIPIISCNTGLIGWITKKYKLGIPININESKMILNTINKLCSNLHRARLYGRNGLRWANSHKSEVFSKIIINNVIKCVDL